MSSTVAPRRTSEAPPPPPAGNPPVGPRPLPPAPPPLKPPAPTVGDSGPPAPFPPAPPPPRGGFRPGAPPRGLVARPPRPPWPRTVLSTSPSPASAPNASTVISHTFWGTVKSSDEPVNENVSEVGWAPAIPAPVTATKAPTTRHALAPLRKVVLVIVRRPRRIESRSTLLTNRTSPQVPWATLSGWRTRSSRPS